MSGNPTESDSASASDPNPYAVSGAEPQHPRKGKPKLLQLLLEAIWSIVVILGIIFGWILLGAGMLEDGDLGFIALGLLLIIALCVIETRRWAARRSLTKRDAEGAD